jgi:hypothetical protein
MPSVSIIPLSDDFASKFYRKTAAHQLPFLKEVTEYLQLLPEKITSFNQSF